MKRATSKQKLDRLQWVCAVVYQCAGVLTDTEWTCTRKQAIMLMDMLAAGANGETYKAKRLADKILPFGIPRAECKPKGIK